MLKILLSILLLGGALILFIQDLKDKRISLFVYILYIILLFIFQLLFTIPQQRLSKPSYIANLLVASFFAILFLYYYKNKKIALADILLIIITILLFPIQTGLLIILISSVFGILFSLILNKKSIGFVGILSLITTIILLVI